MMLSQRLPIFSLFCWFLVATIPGGAIAQPLGRHHVSVESMIAPAEFVAIGTIEHVTENVIAVPGPIDQFSARDERGKVEYILTPTFSEILKRVERAGDEGEFKTLRTMDHRAGKNEQLVRWAKNKTAGLWLIHPKNESQMFRRWEFIPFNERGVNHFGYRSSSLQAPMLARDLSILDTQAEIIRRIREYGPISQKAHHRGQPSVVSIRIPFAVLGEMESGDFNQLSLPIDAELLKTARRLIQSPAEFVSPRVATEDPHALDTLCEAGIDLLGAMKTDASIKLLKDCLDASILPFKHSLSDHRIRAKAYERLLDWRVHVPRPAFSAKVTSLFLSSTDINNDTLALVSGFENLEALYLWETRISHHGTEHLAKLKKLKLLALDNEHLTDEMLHTLRKNNQLHLISQATTEDGHLRPRSLEEVTKLRFWCAPFSDSGLKEFAGCRNLTLLDLGRMRITDAGITHLAEFKKLRFALLHETGISPKGFAQLRQALPNCSVESR